MRKFVFGVILALANPVVIGLHIHPSMAQTAQQLKICEGSNSAASTDYSTQQLQIISSCSAIIQTGHLPDGKPIPPKKLAQFYVDRAISYETFNDYERAIADHEKAVAFFPGTQTNIDRLKNRLLWLRYLKEIQDD